MKLPAPIRHSLAARLALVYGLVSVLVVAVLGLGVYFLTARYLDLRAEQDLSALADFYAAYTAATTTDEAGLVALAPQIAGFFAPQAGYDVRLFSARTGTLLAATYDTGSLPSSTALAELSFRRPTLFLAASHDLPGRRYAARPVTAADGTVLAVVEVSRDLGDVRAFLAVLRLVLIGSGAVALFVALAASLLLARRMTRPLRGAEAATQAIAAGDFSRRLAVTSEDEIGRLTAGINHMASDLSRLEAARREFIAKVSHDLRTPLTAIKGFIVNLLDSAPPESQPTLATMDEQADRLIRLVDDLLAASRLQRGELRLSLVPVDLAAVARSAAALMARKAAQLGVAIDLDLPAATRPTVTGDAGRLQQVIVNLLDNAVKAAPPGTAVRLALIAGPSELQLTVSDDGPGLTPEAEARAFEPYFRGPGGGLGLGLTIAHELVAAHGGRIWLRDRPAGGAQAGFALPLHPTTGP
jgi:signal transduction histidine kinase